MEELLCVGCGIKLQCEDESKEGYVNPNAFTRSFILCKRCYQLKHYGKFVESKQLKNTIHLLKESARTDDLIVLVADVALTYTPLIKVLKELNSYENVVLICNRYDLYKEFIKKEKALLFLKNQAKKDKINFKEIFIIDDDVNEIFDYLDYHSNNKNIYLVGLENAGKTTLVNRILKDVAKEDKNFLVNSKYPGTTIDLIKIPLTEDTYLIDSPGIHSKGNILSYVEFDFIKKLQGDNKIKSSIFQLNCHQSLLISNILRFDYIKGEKQSIVFYGSNMLDILRCKLEKANDTFKNRMKDLDLKTKNVKNITDLTKKTINIEEDVKHDIVIEGLGFFSVKKGVYTIYTFKDVNIFIRKSMI